MTKKGFDSFVKGLLDAKPNKSKSKDKKKGQPKVTAEPEVKSEELGDAGLLKLL